jgi:cyclophilin family peptidyl-prolyl cis-trans isomerase
MHALLRTIPVLLLTLMSTPGFTEDFPKIRFETTAGNFVVELDATRAPLTAANFVQYVKEGFYTGTIFHRVINGFVVQGGGYTADLEAKPTREPIANESGNGLSNRRLTIAMARTSDPHSADSQFYINLADNLELDPKPTRWGYAVFGQVVEGVDVVDDIGYRPTSPQGAFQNLPAAPVIVERAVLLTDGSDE